MAWRASIFLCCLLPLAGARAELFRIQQAGRWGFINQAGQVVVPPQFEYCGNQENGLVWVRKRSADRMSGRFVDAAGRIIPDQAVGDLDPIRPELPDPAFEPGALAVVRTGPDAYAWLARDGRVVGATRPADFFQRNTNQWQLAINARGGITFVKRNGLGWMAKSFEDARPFWGGFAPAMMSGQWGLIDEQGGWAKQPEYDELEACPDNPTLWKCRKEMKWGLLATSGEEKAAPQFDEIAEVRGLLFTARSDAQWWVRRLDDAGARFGPYEKTGMIGRQCGWIKQEGQWGVVAADGKMLIAPRFEQAGDFDWENGVGQVGLNDHLGLVSLEGKLLFEPEFEYLSAPRGGVAAIRMKDLWGLVSLRGEMLAKPQFEGIREYESFQDGVAAARLAGRWGLWNIRAGGWVLSPAYDSIQRWHDLVALQQGETWALFTLRGVERISFKKGITRLPEAHAMPEGRGRFAQGAKEGLLDTAGRICLAAQYDEVIPTAGDLIPTRAGAQWGFVDAKGVWRIAPQYEKAQPFQNGYAAVCNRGRWGFISPAGEVAVAMEYDAAGSFQYGLFAVARKDESSGVLQWGLVNAAGEPILPLRHDFLAWP